MSSPSPSDSCAASIETKRPAERSAIHLKVEGLVVRRGERTVLDGLSFEVARGEIFGLLGPNGAGKTTAFHVLTGLLEADRGRMVFEDKVVAPGDREFRARVGVVFQEPALDPRLSARENLVLGAGLYGVPKRVAIPRIDELLGRMELLDRAGEPVSRFSGGMRRRVELARALIHEPAFLILDEPTTGFDEGAFRGTWRYLRGLRDEKRITLLLTTHRPEEAEQCDRLGILDGGKLIACDTPDRLRSRVRGDLLVLETEHGAAVAAVLRERFGIEARVLDDRVLLERERGHELVPRIVEAFPERTLRSVSIRRVGLGEVFLELTGRRLEAEGSLGASAGSAA
jgi:ABC-2 type transport system ATP-binding protein